MRKEKLIEELAMAMTHSEQGHYKKNEEFVKHYIDKFLSEQFSSLSALRQLFAELPPDHTFTAKELHEAIESFHPLMTKKQEQQLVDNLWEIVNEKLEPKLSSCCQALITDEFENEGVCLKCGEHCGVYKELKK